MCKKIHFEWTGLGNAAQNQEVIVSCQYVPKQISTCSLSGASLVTSGLLLLNHYKCSDAACELISILPFGVWPHSFFLSVVPLILVLFCNAISFTFQMYLVSRYFEPVTFLGLRHIDHLDTYCASLKNKLFSPASAFTRRFY